MKYTLSQNIWDTFEPTTIDVPDYWNTALHDMKGDSMKPLTLDEIRHKIHHPFGLPPIAEFAKGAKKVGIVFDDLARGTPVRVIAPLVLDELRKACVPKDKVVFLCAEGNHGAHNREDFQQKLGADILEEYCVFNHNPYENLVEIGESSRGNPVLLNRELYSCDCKIGIGGITPHLDNAFGGGIKILFPGMAGIQTTIDNHVIGAEYRKRHNLSPVQAMGDLKNSGMREDLESMGRMVGDFFKIDAVYNSKLEILHVTAGDAIQEYYEGVKFAQQSYATKRVNDKDVVIANINGKSSEPFLGILMGVLGLKKTGGSLIIVNFSKRGLIPHYLIGQFGLEYGGQFYGDCALKDPCVKKLIYYSPYSEKNLETYLATQPGIFVHCRTWHEVLEQVAGYGPGTDAAVMTDSTIQYFVD
jgi:lactate racemase